MKPPATFPPPMRAPAAMTATCLLVLPILVGALAHAAPPAWIPYSYEGSLATATCLQSADGTTCQSLLGGANTARTLASLGAPGTPYRWAGNITWGGLPTSSVFQATLVADVGGTATGLERIEGPTVIEFDFRLDDHPGATGFALHIHGFQAYGPGPSLSIEHRQTFFVDGRVFTK